MDATVTSAANRRYATRPLLVALLLLIAGCGIGALLSGYGHQLGWWDYRTGFSVLRWSVWIAAGAGVVALIAFLAAAAGKQPRAMAMALVGAALAGAIVLPAWQHQRNGTLVPRINDITTDTDNPPAFVAVVPLRQDAPNPVTYGGAAVAREQQAAYADIKPVRLKLPPGPAFERALATAREMGWTIVAAEPGVGRIEATDQTRWFGFKDDVVIRVTEADGGSRVDIRSKSRIGRNDFGTNAKRVRAYSRKLEATAH